MSQATMHTNHGAIELELFDDAAPKTVQNFKDLAQKGFYDNLGFHRIIEGFMIQGGCPLGTGTGDGGYKIKAEFNKTKHVPGVLSMARSSDPNSAGTQFFICLAAHSHLDGQYTAFGKVADDASMATLKAIGSVEMGHGDKPVEKVIIKKATVIEKAK